MELDANLYSIVHKFVRIKFHFLENKDYHLTRYNEKSVISHAQKYVDIDFISNKSEKALLPYFLYLFFSRQTNRIKQNMKLLYTKDDYKNFLFSIKNYKSKAEDEFSIVYNSKTFEKLVSLYYNKKISPLTFFIVVSKKYQDKVEYFEKSNIYGSLYYDIQKLSNFINIDEDFANNYVKRLEE